MNSLQLYRKRIIPAECILLKNDEVVFSDDDVVITKWATINPKLEFDHGCSCYFLKLGIKVSKFYRSDNSLLYWYCDIVEYEMDKENNTLTCTDLLADVIINPDGAFRVVDLDELADALSKGLITNEQMVSCLQNLNHLLSLIYRDKFDRLQDRFKQLGL